MTFAGQTSSADQLSNERALDRLYRQHMRRQAERPVQADGPRNGFFVGTGLRKPRNRPDGRLHGRVALSNPDPDLGISEFYIGNGYAHIAGVDIFNWKSDYARSFFEGTFHEPLPENVAAVRTFVRNDSDIVRYVDDVLRADAPQPIFPTREVPRHPAPEKTASKTPPRRRTKHSRGRTDAAQRPTTRSTPFVRAESLLREQLEAPRTDSLRPVLATLQRDQYRLVTAPANASMIVEGGPGTGKSIIASHRTAFLADREWGAGPKSAHDVLIVGPTNSYRRYVISAIEELLSPKSVQVHVASLEEINEFYRDSFVSSRDQVKSPGPLKSRPDLPRQVATLIADACNRLREDGQTKVTTAEVYNYLRRNGLAWRPLTQEASIRQFLGRLTDYGRIPPGSASAAVRDLIDQHLSRRYSKGDADKARIKDGPIKPVFSHVIVDEAQDVTLQEWLMLARLNHGGTWTILGDLNQRRAGKTPQTWNTVLKAIGLPADTPVRRLERGYRSTVPILKFANRLLPPAGATPVALRTDGDDVVIENPPIELREAAVVRQVERLRVRHAGGTVAVITRMPKPIQELLPDDVEGARVKVLWPNEARGLEFDAVVVVEPADFPRNEDGRYGLLYTALTRSNKELVIVHSKPLPGPLQERLRHTKPFTGPVAPRRAPKKTETKKKKNKKARNKRQQPVQRKIRSTSDRSRRPSP